MTGFKAQLLIVNIVSLSYAAHRWLENHFEFKIFSLPTVSMEPTNGTDLGWGFNQLIPISDTLDTQWSWYLMDNLPSYLNMVGHMTSPTCGSHDLTNHMGHTTSPTSVSNDLNQPYGSHA